MAPIPLHRNSKFLFFLCGLFTLAVSLAGCGFQAEPYADDIRYLMRGDPLVMSIPETQPVGMDPPGALDEMARLIESKKGKVLDPVKVDAKDRANLDAALEEVFGRPAHPSVKGNFPDSDDEISDDSQLKLDSKTLARGSVLYRQHCLHCHGLNGDGRGPTASWVVPHPRDYRQGKFKFSSSSQPTGSRKPRREDLVRTLKQGVEGTSMPSFGLLPQADLESLVSYVIHLSLRGQVEYDVLQTLIQKNELEGDSVKDHIADRLGKFANQWREAETKMIKPLSNPGYAMGSAEFKESAKRGYKLFVEQGSAGCVSCHKDFGRKNEYRYDEWGTIVRPANLTKAEYRGGRRPLDFYWRVHSGINGTGMPAFADSLIVKKPDGSMDDSKVWDMVHFLEILPYPKMLADCGIEIK